MSRSITQLLHVLPAAAYVLLIFYLGSLPPGSNVTPNLNDKVAHALGFAALVPLDLLAVGALKATWTPRARWLAAAGVAIAVGGLLELHQLAFTRRSAEWGDWLADIVGVAVAVALLAAYRAWCPAEVAPASES